MSCTWDDEMLCCLVPVWPVREMPGAHSIACHF